jgi:hypothetical protein
VLKLNEEFLSLTAKLTGIILKKAELDGDFSAVYSEIFKRMVELEEFDEDFLIVLGEVGG